MIVAAFSILAFLLVIKPQTHGLKEMASFITDEWVAGFTGHYPKPEATTFLTEWRWLEGEIVNVRRQRPLAKSTAHQLSGSFLNAAAFIDDLEKIRYALFTRMALAGGGVVFLRLMLEVKPNYLLYDWVIQLLGSGFVASLIIVLHRRLFVHPLWKGGFTDDGKSLVRQFLGEEGYQDGQLNALRQTELLTGVDLQFARETLLSVQTNGSAATNLRLDSALRLKIAVFDLLGVGSVIFAGGFFPVLGGITTS